MGVEFAGNHEIEMAVEDSGYYSDSEVVAHIQEALRSVVQVILYLASIFSLSLSLYFRLVSFEWIYLVV